MAWYDIFGFTARRQQSQKPVQPQSTRRTRRKRNVANVVVIPTGSAMPLINTRSGLVHRFSMKKNSRRRP
jgi:hypothetical protein